MMALLLCIRDAAKPTWADMKLWPFGRSMGLGPGSWASGTWIPGYFSTSHMQGWGVCCQPLSPDQRGCAVNRSGDPIPPVSGMLMFQGLSVFLPLLDPDLDLAP